MNGDYDDWNDDDDDELLATWMLPDMSQVPPPDLVINDGVHHDVHHDNPMDLTDEAQADLANNNDPNNNSDNQHAVPNREAPAASSSAALADTRHPAHNPLDRPAAEEAQMEADVCLVLEWIQDGDASRVRRHLESHRHHPNRVQMVLEQYFDNEYSGPRMRGKVGNGLRSKNSSSSALNVKQPNQQLDFCSTVHPLDSLQSSWDCSSSDTLSKRSLDRSSTINDWKDDEWSAKRSKLEPLTCSLSDLGDTADLDASSPEVIEITPGTSGLHSSREVATEEQVNSLFQNLHAMFPRISTSFLRRQAEQLVDKPAKIDRLITQLLETPEECVGHPSQELSASEPEPSAAAVEVVDLESPSQVEDSGNIEDKVCLYFQNLVGLFPDADPEFLQKKAEEFTDKAEDMAVWINQSLESKGQDFPTRKDYEKRRQEAEMLEKYSRQVSVSEILDMYDDPEQYFSDTARVVSPLYMDHCKAQLKKEFRLIPVDAIYKVVNQHKGHFLPSLRQLKEFKGQRRKTKRNAHEFNIPQEMDFNFLKELQYSRIADQVMLYMQEKEKIREEKITEAKSRDMLKECHCCFSNECLEEELLSCGDPAHLFCLDCVRRASQVAIGDGKTKLHCLTNCSNFFSLSTLQKALKANSFSKWLTKIQLAEVEEAGIPGLEHCPFCSFATINERSAEEDKVFVCMNPECGKESCRLCHEMSHIPLKCDEVEKDAEVRKRTFIENKMAEAIIRRCWKCSKPFLKLDGCNKITCSCGAKMCYLCRQPVTDYKHFFGHGASPSEGKCPLWSESNNIHEKERAESGLEAKNQMEQENPSVTLKHDPTKDLENVLNQLPAAPRPQPQPQPRPIQMLPIPIPVQPPLGLHRLRQIRRHPNEPHIHHFHVPQFRPYPQQQQQQQQQQHQQQPPPPPPNPQRVHQFHVPQIRPYPPPVVHFDAGGRVHVVDGRHDGYLELLERARLVAHQFAEVMGVALPPLHQDVPMPEM